MFIRGLAIIVLLVGAILFTVWHSLFGTWVYAILMALIVLAIIFLVVNISRLADPSTPKPYRRRNR